MVSLRSRMVLSAPKHEILVVDDSPVYRKLIEQILSGEPYSPLFARNGSEALRIFREKSPSIVLTDWMMPDFSGPELCQRIRADKSAGYTYLILMTSNGAKDSVVKGLEAGADDYLSKPFDSAEMRARIGVGRRIVELHQQLGRKSAALEEAARTDSLTGLPNRRAIEEWARKQLKGASRHGFPIWVVMGDLDSFKQINDTFGHEAGDDVLRAFADTLRSGTRASDMCGRLGGDEFLLVVTHVSLEDIQATVDRFRQQFAALSFPFAGQNVSLTVTLGVAGSQRGELTDFGAMVRRADEMLYEGKRAGKNCIRVANLG